MTSIFKKTLLAGTALVAMSAVAHASPLDSQAPGTGTVVIDGQGVLIDHDPSAATAIQFLSDDTAAVDAGINITGNIVATGGEGFGTLEFNGSSTVSGDVGAVTDTTSYLYAVIGGSTGTVTFSKTVSALNASADNGKMVFNGAALLQNAVFTGDGEMDFNADTHLSTLDFNDHDGTVVLGGGITFTGDMVNNGGEGHYGNLNVLGSATINGNIGGNDGLNVVQFGTGDTTASTLIDVTGTVYANNIVIDSKGTTNFNGYVDADNDIYVEDSGTTNFNGYVDAGTIVAYGTHKMTFNDGLDVNNIALVGDNTVTITSGGEGWGNINSYAGASAGAGAGTVNISLDDNSLLLHGDIGTGGEGFMKALNITGAGNEFIVDGNVGQIDTIDLGGNTLYVDGDFTAGQTIKTTVTEVDGSDIIGGHITGSGDVTIGAGTKVNVAISSLTDLEVGQQFIIADGTDGDYGDVATLTTGNISSSPLITWTQVADPDHDSLILEIASIKTLSEVATGGNNKSISSAISSDCADPDASCHSLYTTLLAAPDAATFNAALESAQPAGLNGSSIVSTLDAQGQALQVIEKTMIAMRDGDASASGMAAGAMPKGLSAWAQGYGQAAQQGIRDGIAGYKSDTAGFAMGVDTAKYAGDKNDVFGAAVNFGRTNVNSSNANTTGADIDSYGITVYGSKEMGGNAFLAGQVGYAYNDIDTFRHNAGAAGLTANANYSSDQYSAKLLAGKDYEAGHSIVLTPTAFATYTYLHTDGYSETGTGTLLSVDSDNFDVFKVGAGLQAEWKLKSATGEKLKPSLHANYTYDVTGDSVESTASFVGGGATFKTTGADPARSEFNAGAGLTYTTQSNFDVTAIYDYNYKTDYTAQSGLLRGTVHF